MTAHTRFWRTFIGAAVVALVAPLFAVVAMASSASAAVGPRPHEVYMYKVEAHVDLSGEYPDNYLHTHLYCNDGDYALDGMWRVDHVDQANPQLGTVGDERDVVFYASYGDTSHPDMWHFRMENYATGNAQVKLFLTCIRKTTEQAAGHSHGIRLRPLSSSFNRYFNFGRNEWSPNSNSGCASNEYAVAPGFNFVNDNWNRMLGSYPTSSFRGWQWAFEVNSHSPVHVTLYLRCLRDVVHNAGSPSHSHKLPMMWRTNNSHPYNGVVTSHLTSGISEQRLSCDDGSNGAFYQDYKAMVGAFWLNDWHYQWYLGMDPRPKTRAYKFWDEGGGHNVRLNIFCIKSRTGPQIKPVV